MYTKPIIALCPICGTMLAAKEVYSATNEEYTLSLSCPNKHMVGNTWKGPLLGELYMDAADFYAQSYCAKHNSSLKKPASTIKCSDLGGNDHGHSKNAAMTRAAYFKARRIG